MKKNKIDILMATYNGERYIRDQIKSIINQTYSNWHLIIRDDGSTDKTLEIIEKMSEEEKKITLISDKKGNLGLVKNFEELLNYSTAEFIMFSDQDDIWNLEKLNEYFKIVKDKKNTLVHSNAVLYKGIADKRNKSFISNKFLEKNFKNIFFNFFVQGSTIMITKEMKEFFLPFPKEVYLHDRYIHLMSELFFERIFINKPLICYRQHQNNQIGANSSLKKLIKKRYFDSRDYELIKIIYKKYKKQLSNEKKKAVEKYFEIVNEKNNRFKRYGILKKENIYMPLKKQISLLVKG